MIWTIILCNLDCGRLDRIGFVTEKAIADLRVLVSGHTRMALGNTRMSCLVRVWRGLTRMGEKDDILNVNWSLLVRVRGDCYA
jgi:hypothetical protein